MISLSVIILSYAIDDDIYRMNCQCISSLLESDQWEEEKLEILLIESRKDNPYKYVRNVEVIIPDESFNFHKFLNIGVKYSKGKIIAFCNNDIIFQKSWYNEILKVKTNHPHFLCFSPLDSDYPMMAELVSTGREYYIGWENKRHYAAWCMVWDRKIFDVIGDFDETFDFYSADDDELMTLRKYAIENVLVARSEVKHLSQVVTNKDGVDKYKVFDKDNYPLSENEIKRGLTWLWDDVRFYVAYRRLEEKWGNGRMIGRINRMLDHFKWLRIRPITIILYNKYTNMILSKITGV